MSIGKQLGASLTGNIETALLVIHDYRSKAKELTSGEQKLTQAAALAKINESVINDTIQSLSTGSAPTYTDSIEKTMQVQFNPAELTINASAIPKSKMNASDGDSRTMAVEDAKLTLTVTLYFDDMDTYDAFLLDKFTAGLSSTGISNIAKTVSGNSTVHSVQGRVEALVAALRNPFTRMISFRWADFSFIGQLNSVHANYTMFSAAGRPIRAQVLLRIQHEMDPDMLQGWYKNFDTVFQGKSSDLVTKEQTMSSLLNLNL
jgi:hypothetical protein